MGETDSNQRQEGGMLTGILAFFSFLASLWGSIPKEKQEQIMSTIADGFDEALRAFFRLFRKQEQQASKPSNEAESPEQTQNA